MKLHEYHARSLEAALSRADQAMNRMEQLLEDGGHEGVVRKIENSLPPMARGLLLAELRSLRVLLNSMAQTFSLEEHALDMRAVMNAELSTLRVVFENCRPSRMKGYGQGFAPEARTALEEIVEKLLTQILTIRAQLG
jgi:hypothetical protein